MLCVEHALVKFLKQNSWISSSGDACQELCCFSEVIGALLDSVWLFRRFGEAIVLMITFCLTFVTVLVAILTVDWCIFSRTEAQLGFWMHGWLRLRMVNDRWLWLRNDMRLLRDREWWKQWIYGACRLSDW